MDGGDKIETAKSVPYFIKDNKNYVKKALKGEVALTKTSFYHYLQENDIMKKENIDITQYKAAMKLGRNAEREMYKLVNNIGMPVLSDEQKQNIIDLAKTKGLGSGHISPMDYLSADSGASNPTKDEINCQSVVVAFEARRRGLDCFALPYDGNETSASFRLGENFALAWVNPKNGKVMNPTKLSGRSDDEIITKLEKELKVPGRYVLGINYKGNIGHVISVDVTPAKEIIVHDEQDDSYFSLRSLENLEFLELLKIDRAVFNIEIVESILRVF